MNPIKPVVTKLGPPPRANVPVPIGPQSLVVGAWNPSGDPVPLIKPVPPTPPPPPLTTMRDGVLGTIGTSATALPPPNVPVPMPPPPIVEDPVGYDGYIEAALKARKGRMDYAQFWAAMAQAEATKLVAAKLEGLLEFVGFYDEVSDEDAEAGATLPRLDSIIAAGIQLADMRLMAKPEKKSKKKD